MAEWSFAEDSKLQTLPMDKIKENYVRRHVPNAIFSEVWPTPLKNPPQIVCTR